MEGSAQESVGTQSSWLRCYRCWSQNLEVQLHYEGILKVDADTGEAVDPVEEVQEAVVQCLDCLHDQPHLALTFYEEDGRRISRVEPVEDRWERMVTGTPWVASCTVTVDADQVESCSGPEAAESLAFAAFGDHGTREFFTHVRFHKHEDDRIVIHMLVELYARSSDEATEVMEDAARGDADDHLAGGGVPPAGVERRRGALGAVSASARRRLGKRGDLVVAERPARASTSAVCSPEERRRARVGARVAPQIGEATRSSGPGGRVVDGDAWPARPAAAAARQRLGHRAHLADRHAGGVERRQPLLGRPLAKPLLPAAGQLAAVLDAAGVGGEALVGGQLVEARARRRARRNSPSLAAAIASRPDAVSKVLVGHDVRVRVAVALRLRAGDQRVLGHVDEPGEAAVEQRHLDPRALSPVQRGQDRRRRRAGRRARPRARRRPCRAARPRPR